MGGFSGLLDDARARLAGPCPVGDALALLDDIDRADAQLALATDPPVVVALAFAGLGYVLDVDSVASHAGGQCTCTIPEPTTTEEAPL